MALYQTKNAQCYDHDDCRADPEMARECAFDHLRRGVLLDYVPGQWMKKAEIPIDGFDRVVSGRMNHGHVEITIETYTGRVLEVWSAPVQIMSDVWDDCKHARVMRDDGTFAVVIGRCEYDGGEGEWTADATPDVRARYLRDQQEKAAKSRAQQKERDEREAKQDLLAPYRGRMVRVVKGRKVPIGTKGLCVWYGQGSYGYRVGIEAPSKRKEDTIWTAASNVEALVPYAD